MVNFSPFRFFGALYEKSRKYERPRYLSEAIFVILGAESNCSRALWDYPNCTINRQPVSK